MGIAAEESLDHFDLLRSLWGSRAEERQLTVYPAQPSRSQPASPTDLEELPQSAELASPWFGDGVSMAATP